MNEIYSTIIDDKYKYLNSSEVEQNQSYFNEKFYLIGSSSIKTTRHEVAHGLYYLNSSYKKQMNYLTNNLPDNFRNDIYEWFTSIGYTKKVFKDEMQAYMATGFKIDFFKTKLVQNIKKYEVEYKEIFNKYYK